MFYQTGQEDRLPRNSILATVTYGSFCYIACLFIELRHQATLGVISNMIAGPVPPKNVSTHCYLNIILTNSS